MKKIIFDFILNISSVAIPVFVLQFLILPLLNSNSNLEYGKIITLISLFTTISLPFGVSLNNASLLKSQTNKESNNFNNLFLKTIPINSVLLIIGLILIIKDISLVDILFLLLIGWFTIFREYGNVRFRIKLQYKKILMNNLILSLGYILGYILFVVCNVWYIIYLSGLVFASVHIFLSTKIFKFGFTKDDNYFSSRNMVIILLIASFIGTLVNYIDKLILYPLLGDESVAIYYAATIFGKIIIQFISPINSVMLSYVAKEKDISKKVFLKVLFLTMIIGCVGYLICIITSEHILSFLYPNLKSSAIGLIPIVTLSSVVKMIYTMVNPFVLRFKSINWQILLNSFNLVIYLIAGLLLMNHGGLIGFCYGGLMANIASVILIIIIFLYKRKEVIGVD